MGVFLNTTCAWTKKEPVKLHIQPTVVILSMRVDEIVEKHFDPDGRSRGSINGNGKELPSHVCDSVAYALCALTGDQFALPYVLEFRPSPEFDYEAGKSKLLNLHLFADGSSEVSFTTPGDSDPYNDYGDSNDAGYTGRQGQLLRLSASIDMESRLTIGCAGALLTYVARRKAVERVPTDINANSSFRVSKLQMFTLKETM